MIVDDDQVGVSIAIPRHSIDMRVPSHTVVASMMADLVDKYREILESTDRDTEFFSGTHSWHLEKIGGQAISPEGTLADAGVREGAQIHLRRGDPTEAYPELIDDHAEFIAYHQNQQFEAWSPKHARLLSAVGLMICAAAGLGGLITYAGTHPHLSMFARYGSVAGLIAAAALVFVITFVCDHADDPQTNSVPQWGFWLGYALTATAAALVIPRPLSAYAAVVVAVVLATLAGIIYSATKEHPLVHVTIISAALLLAGPLLLAQLYPWPTMVVAAQIMAVGLIALWRSPDLALALAKIVQPYVPATGESYIKNLKGDVSQLPLITSKDETLDSIFHQKARVSSLRYATLAITIGVTAAMVAAAFFVGWTQIGAWPVAAIYVALIATALVFRGQSCGDAALQGAFWISGVASLLAFLAGSVIITGFTVAAASTLAAMIVVMGLAVIVSVRQATLNSNYLKKCVDVFEKFVYFLPFIILGADFMHLYELFRAW